MYKYKVSYKKENVNVEHTFNNERKAFQFISMCFNFGFTNVNIQQFKITEK